MDYRQMSRRVLCLMLCLMTVLSSISFAFADTLAYTNKKTVIYVEASGKLKKVGTAPKGTEVVILDTNDGWAQVQKDGKVAYMQLSALTEKAADSDDANIVECDKNIYAAVEGVIVYEDPDIESEQLTTLAKGTKQRMVAYDDEWCRVKNGKFYGYVLRDEMSLEPIASQSTAAPIDEDDGVTNCNKKVYVAVDGAKVYASASTSAKVKDTLPLGQKLTMTSYTDRWCFVKAGGNSGYMLRSELSLTQVNPATPAPTQDADDNVTTCNKTVYVAVAGAKVYASDSTSAKVQDTLPLGQKLTMTAYTDTWCLVKAGSNKGYMLRSELSLTKINAATPTPAPTQTADSENVTTCNKKVYVAVDGAKVYSAASASSKVQDTLPLGQKLTMTAYTDTWCLVKSGSKSGFMKRSELSLEPVSAATPTPTATPTPAPTNDGVTACNKTGYAIEDGVKVYAKASTSGKVIDTLSKNQQVNVTGYTDKWCQVKNGKNVGYVLREKLSDSEIIDMPNELKYGDTGEAVKKLQTRLKELNYFSGTVGGNYLGQTRTAVETFQRQNGLTVDGTAGQKTLKLLFSDDAKPYDPKQDEPSDSGNDGGSTATGPTNGNVQEMDWWTSGIQSIFSRGTTATITDCSTGISWKERRNGGTNHADVQPVTAADTAAMKSAVGSWSWNRRAIWVTIGGKNYAASMNCMPHGSGSIVDNNFDGHHCIHFTNSRTHGTNQVCSLHQAAIKKALKYNP